MMLSGFTDDHSIWKSFTAKCHTSEEHTTNTMENTLTTIAEWMTSMWLKLNSDRTEFMMFGSRANAKICKHISPELWHNSHTMKQTGQVSRWAPRLLPHI